MQFDYTKLLEYCVAIGNEGGGLLIFGVSDPDTRDGRLVPEHSQATLNLSPEFSASWDFALTYKS